MPLGSAQPLLRQPGQPPVRHHLPHHPQPLRQRPHAGLRLEYSLHDPACPWDNTHHTFYDNYYRRCVLDCPSSPSYYALDETTSGTCVQYCPSGTFALDDLSRKCSATCPVYYFTNYKLNVV